ncbi:MAG: hypothetical protein KDB61_04320, partial [Planctomycetes bacterium]|nr:hypothetical protein [Planctomycetota bacterium]
IQSAKVSPWMHSRTLLLVGVDQLSHENQAALAQCPPPGRILMTSASPASSLHPALVNWVGIDRLNLEGLAEHVEDVPQLAKHFLAMLDADAELAPGVPEILMGYPWPGNVGELERCIGVAHMQASLEFEPGEKVIVGLDQLPESILSHARNGSRGTSESARELKPWDITDQDPIDFDHYERKAILRALDHCKNNRVACARMLRLGKSTLYRKLKRLGIDSDIEIEE